jgi:hypothetical protein
MEVHPMVSLSESPAPQSGRFWRWVRRAATIVTAILAILAGLVAFLANYTPARENFWTVIADIQRVWTGRPQTREVSGPAPQASAQAPCIGLTVSELTYAMAGSGGEFRGRGLCGWTLPAHWKPVQLETGVWRATLFRAADLPLVVVDTDMDLSKVERGDMVRAEGGKVERRWPEQWPHGIILVTGARAWKALKR